MSEELKYCYKHPHPSITTDCVVFGFDGVRLNLLLIRRGLDPFKGKWAFPGGFMRITETAEECARRELKEETGVSDIFLEQIHAFSDVDRDPRERVVTIAFFALIRHSDYKVIGGDDAAEARWFPLSEIPPLAFDHDRILRHALKHLRLKIHFEPIGFRLLDEKFSMSELQRLYESILDVKFDRRNFNKKILSLGIVEPTNEKIATGGRASQLYSFNEEKYWELKEKGMRLEF